MLRRHMRKNDSARQSGWAQRTLCALTLSQASRKRQDAAAARPTRSEASIDPEPSLSTCTRTTRGGTRHGGLDEVQEFRDKATASRAGILPHNRPDANRLSCCGSSVAFADCVALAGPSHSLYLFEDLLALVKYFLWHYPRREHAVGPHAPTRHPRFVQSGSWQVSPRV